MLRVRDAAGTRVTQFEALTAAAFCAFEAAGVEWGVVEAGLGGRLDATNVLPRSRVQVLTNVSLEHTQLLGTTREAIAAEKLAVVPEGGLLVVGRAGVGGARAPGGIGRGGAGRRDLPGSEPRGGPGRRGARPRPAGRPCARCSGCACPGGWRCAAANPLEVWDGAHNPDGMARLVAELPALVEGRAPRVAVFSTLGEKDVAGMVKLLSGVCDVIVATQSTNPRVLPAAELAAITGGEFEPDPGRGARARDRAFGAERCGNRLRLAVSFT